MSPWDAKESLPRAYGRLFDLGNFKATQRRVLERDLASAKRAEQANLLKLLPSATTAPSNDIAASSFSLLSANEGDGGEDMEGRLMITEDGEEKQNKNELRADGWISSGTYVTLLISAMSDELLQAEIEESTATATSSLNFTKDMAKFTQLIHDHSHTFSCAPMSLHALHRHENRLTCVHASIQRASAHMLDPGIYIDIVMWCTC